MVVLNCVGWARYLKTCMLSGETNGDQAKVHPSIAVAKASHVPKSN